VRSTPTIARSRLRYLNAGGAALDDDPGEHH
jgi:hypothetical protein